VAVITPPVECSGYGLVSVPLQTGQGKVAGRSRA
jgi:hypothetical protein